MKKAIPWIVGVIIFAVIVNVANLNGILLGGIPIAILVGLIIWACRKAGSDDSESKPDTQLRPNAYTTISPSNSKFELKPHDNSTLHHQTESRAPQNQAWTASVAHEDNSAPAPQTIESNETHIGNLPQHNEEMNKDKAKNNSSLEHIIVDTVIKSIDILQGKFSFTDAQKAETAIFAKTLFYQYISKDITAHSLAFAYLVKNLKQNSDMPEDVIANIMRMREVEYMKLISAEGIEAMVSAYINDIADLGGDNFDKEEFYARVRSFVKEVQE